MVMGDRIKMESGGDKVLSDVEPGDDAGEPKPDDRSGASDRANPQQDRVRRLE